MMTMKRFRNLVGLDMHSQGSKSIITPTTLPVEGQTPGRGTVHEIPEKSHGVSDGHMGINNPSAAFVFNATSNSTKHDELSSRINKGNMEPNGPNDSCNGIPTEATSQSIDLNREIMLASESHQGGNVSEVESPASEEHITVEIAKMVDVDLEVENKVMADILGVENNVMYQ
ncbi:hypothetical protein L1887_28350 [Cichorium endivia]|nr:hypothetical protein L1887_28350 [Cichorium endivia]